jgi:hypothetical protein
MNTPRRRGALHFSKPPFRTNLIVSNTALLVFVLTMMGWLVIHYWNRIPALSICSIFATAFLLIVFWGLVLRTHCELHELLMSGKDNLPEPGSREDLAFGVIAGLSFQALLITASLAWISVMGLAEILHKR